MIAAVTMLTLLACSQPAPTTPATTEPVATTTTAAPEGPRVTLANGSVQSVEVVADDELRAQGLMFRDHLRPDSGMLFVFPADGVYPFWMKNTLIPLDIIWIDADRKVVHVKHDVPPCKVEDCPSYSPGVPARYVLELAAGEAKKHGIREGDQLTFDGIDDVAAR